MRTDTDGLTNIAEEVHQILADAEREIAIPQEWIQRFGKWARLKEIVQIMIDEDKYYAKEMERLETAVEEHDDKIRDIKDEIEEAVDDLEDIDADGNAYEAIKDVIRQLKNIV